MSEDNSAPPGIDFNTFVLSLSTSALMHLGKLPGSEDQTVNLAHAKQSIDCIALLEEKTKGNLTGEEERLISEVLYDLRLRFAVCVGGCLYRSVGDRAPDLGEIRRLPERFGIANHIDDGVDHPGF